MAETPLTPDHAEAGLADADVGRTPRPLPPPDPPVRVVVIDQRHDRRRLMGQVVDLGGDDTVVVGYAEDTTTAVDAVGRLNATAALVEVQLPGQLAMEIISALRLAGPGLRIVVCSFHHNHDTRRTALERGADHYITKPVSPADLHRLFALHTSPM